MKSRKWTVALCLAVVMLISATTAMAYPNIPYNYYLTGTTESAPYASGIAYKSGPQSMPASVHCNTTNCLSTVSYRVFWGNDYDAGCITTTSFVLTGGGLMYYQGTIYNLNMLQLMLAGRLNTTEPNPGTYKYASGNWSPDNY